MYLFSKNCGRIAALILFLSISCASKKEIQSDFPQKIAQIYFQQWIGGQELTGRGIYFYIQFEEPLGKEIQLEKVYFRGNEAVLNQENENNYKANFFRKNGTENTSKNKKPAFDLTENQAILTYKINNKTFYFKFENLKERELIAFPSVGKPRK
jgi:hypothetical protein